MSFATIITSDSFLFFHIVPYVSSYVSQSTSLTLLGMYMSASIIIQLLLIVCVVGGFVETYQCHKQLVFPSNLKLIMEHLTQF